MPTGSTDEAARSPCAPHQHEIDSRSPGFRPAPAGQRVPRSCYRYQLRSPRLHGYITIKWNTKKRLLLALLLLSFSLYCIVNLHFRSSPREQKEWECILYVARKEKERTRRRNRFRSNLSSFSPSRRRRRTKTSFESPLMHPTLCLQHAPARIRILVPLFLFFFGWKWWAWLLGSKKVSALHSTRLRSAQQTPELYRGSLQVLFNIRQLFCTPFSNRNLKKKKVPRSISLKWTEPTKLIQLFK